MKIIKEGNMPVSLEIPLLLSGKCHVCKCELECSREDAFRGSVFKDTFYCICPTKGCYSWIVVKEVLQNEDH